ncbi:ATP-binding protein [Pontibacter sp. G13]|uniref:ATP-binding protein n=1 Tax=Pontibacter sp. G13 TaxID=3074898 RepID=UPI00288BE878|nr:ATP-binding protein [Pontibacter sp. G13]WNJ20436.1 ATP-binding protein [Pontibacter sp. G13]
MTFRYLGCLARNIWEISLIGRFTQSFLPIFIILLLIFIGSSFHAHAQSLDSAQILVRQMMEMDEDSIDREVMKGFLTHYPAPEPATDSLMLEELVDLVDRLNDTEGSMKLSEWIERVSIQHLESGKDSALFAPTLIRNYLQRARLERRLGHAEESLTLQFKALGLAEEFNDTLKIISALQNVSTTYFNQGEADRASEYILKAYEIEKQFHPNDISLITLYTLFEHYIGQEMYPEAEDLGTQALQKAIAENHTPFEAIILRSLAYLTFEQQQWKASYDYAARSLAKQQEINMLHQMAYTQYRLSMAALEMGNTSLSLSHARELEALNRQFPNPQNKSLTYETLYLTNKAAGKSRQALKAYEQYIELRDSLNDEDAKRKLLDQEYEYEYQQKALADSLENASVLALQVEETKRKQTTSYLLMAVLGIVLIFGWMLWNRFQITRRQKGIIESEKEKLDQAITELDSANRQLQELDDFKSRFFTNISHEFRTPLTVIQGIMKQIQETPESWLERGSEIVNRNVANLLGLVNQILDLRKIESGNLPLHMIQDDVVKFLKFGVSVFDSLAASKSVKLAFEGPNSALLMDFDPDKLGQIQSNLLSNAIKFTGPDGQVNFKTYRSSDGQLVMEVSDTGRGIADNQLPFIFDRFYQVDSTDTRSGEGTGIGLSLTRELVQLMDGSITVESTVGQGTTFTIKLPISQQAQRQNFALVQAPSFLPKYSEVLERPEKQATNKAERPTLLLIEDNPDIVEYLHACLEDQYELFAASDGEAGVAAAFEQVPDIIISDVMMPKMNGYEVCETLKLDERTSHIPILMLTAKADHDSKLEGYKRGADAYLTKPFDQAELTIRLEKLLEIRKTLQLRYQGTQLPEPTEDPVLQVEDAFITQVRALLLEHLDDATYRGESLCKDLGMSRTNLHRKIKALTGMPITRFIRSVKIAQAQEMLKESDRQISEVAYAVGFNDPAYFTRVFSEDMGISPGEWREKQ